MTEQQLRPIVPADRVRRFAEEQSLICLEPPPFATIAQERAAGGAGDFWERFGGAATDGARKALVIADFGLGSDSPVVLDFGGNASNPPVLRLRWGPYGHGNEWVQGAVDFDDFAAMLGLGQRPAGHRARAGSAAAGVFRRVIVALRRAVR